MNEQLMGQVRHLLGAAGAALAAKGYLAGSLVEPVTGVLMIVLASAWSYFAKKYNIQLMSITPIEEKKPDA